MQGRCGWLRGQYVAIVSWALAVACGNEGAEHGTGGSGGGMSFESGGSSSGGSGDHAAGGASTGGAATGGEIGSGGVPAAGGMVTSGGSGSGGEAVSFDPPFILGADISGTQESDVEYVDTDGQVKTIFEVLANHGFNYVRLRTFVEPGAPYGYASDANGCAGKSETFGDKDHVIAYGKLAKDHGMGFLLDFHYSDVWADPGNQIIPSAWRGAADINELAALAKAYTSEVIAEAIAQGARPDMVQVGNETTPGLMMHVPGPNTDCWGNNPAPAPFGGGTSDWDNLATLLKAGIAGVKEVDDDIQVMLHLENTDHLSGVRSWLNGAMSRGVEFDVLGLSCYTTFQGEPTVWQSTFDALATEFPSLDFVIAEYNPERTRANLIMKELPNGRGLGTFFWEPTASGEWGEAMFTFQGGRLVANSADFQEYDLLLPELGL